MDDKPRTNITRIARPLHVNLTHSLNNSHVKNPSPLFTVEEASGVDMTLDEIM
jgi:hypothetical protein